MSEWTIKLPWPPEPLWQNRRPHWSKRSAATASARFTAKVLAMQVKIPTLPEARLAFTYCPPPRSRPDVQNVPGALKAYIDGIADAMGCDDRKFRPQFPDHLGDRVRGGCIIVKVTA